MPFLDCNGCRLAYQQMGEGPDVVLVHGLATNRAFWYADIAQQLKDRYRVTLYDLRGHAYSETKPSGYSAHSMALDLADLLDQLAIEKAHLIGHSYGGGIALELALMQPQRAQSLSLFDTKVNSLQLEQRLADSPYLSDFEREVLAADGRDWTEERHIGLKYLECLARLRIDGFEAASTSSFTPFGSGRSGLRTARQYLRLLQETQAETEFKQPGAAAEDIKNLGLPLLLMYGENSRCLPSGKRMAALLPEALFHIVPDAGHFFPATHSGLVLDALMPFLLSSLSQSNGSVHATELMS